MKKRIKEDVSMTMSITQTEALNKIVTLINRRERIGHTWTYVLSKTGESELNFRKDLVVHIQDWRTDTDYVTIQYVSGDVFRVECRGQLMLLTGDEFLNLLKNLELVK